MKDQTRAREKALQYNIERVRVFKLAKEMQEEGELSEEEEDYLV